MKILFVDDEAAIVEVVEAMLTSSGHSVETAINGDDAFRIYCQRFDEGQPFDFVLTGLQQPGMNGVTLVEAVLKKRPNQRCGFCTAIPILRKPFVRAELLAFVGDMRASKVIQ